MNTDPLDGVDFDKMETLKAYATLKDLRNRMVPVDNTPLEPYDYSDERWDRDQQAFQDDTEAWWRGRPL